MGSEREACSLFCVLCCFCYCQGCAILTELWCLSLADNNFSSEYPDYATFCCLILDQTHLFVMPGCSRRCLSVVFVKVVVHPSILCCGAGSKLSQREESGGDSSRAKYRDPALLHPFSSLTFSSLSSSVCH